MENLIWYAVYFLAGSYLIYRLFFKKDKSKLEYQRLYNKILDSKECKVKGQYDR